MLNLNRIPTPLGYCNRLKYERQGKFKKRVNSWFREEVRKLYPKHNFDGKDYTLAVVKLPLLDLNGNGIRTYFVREDNHLVLSKYVDLKLKVVDDGD